MKTAYRAPQLSRIGSFEQITKALRVGSRLDADFAQGTPISQVTLS